MIAIIDYGVGNLGSIANMLKKAGVTGVVITSDPEVISQADKMILPGVGAFDQGMINLRERNLVSLLNHQVLEKKKPILGLCLGMQLFSRRSEEGSQPGLGWLEADTCRFHFSANDNNLKVPHMGWNTVEVQTDHPLFSGMEEETRYYFVHSFYLECATPQNILATSFYGYPFASIVGRENILGVQFHPEKSHRFGMRLLRNFVDLA